MMREGETPDLLADLAKEKAFRMTAEEMEQMLDPILYTGRSAAQAKAYLEKIRPIAESGEDISPDISL
jgi:adenylosuccinate lyase